MASEKNAPPKRKKPPAAPGTGRQAAQENAAGEIGFAAKIFAQKTANISLPLALHNGSWYNIFAIAACGGEAPVGFPTECEFCLSWPKKAQARKGERQTYEETDIGRYSISGYDPCTPAGQRTGGG